MKEDIRLRNTPAQATRPASLSGLYPSPRHRFQLSAASESNSRTRKLNGGLDVDSIRSPCCTFVYPPPPLRLNHLPTTIPNRRYEHLNSDYFSPIQKHYYEAQQATPAKERSSQHKPPASPLY